MEANAIRAIAPCGMNCALCIAYQRPKDACMGCNGPDENKPRHCTICKIKNCDELKAGGSGFCFSCTQFPCKRMRDLDKRYTSKYGMSMIHNLQSIQSVGVAEFVDGERVKWACPGCGARLCVHRETCQPCGEKNARFPAAS